MRSKCANNNLVVFEQLIHVQSYACFFFCFFKRTLLCFQLNLCLLPPFWVGWMSTCVFVCTVHCVHVGVWTQDTFVSMCFDFANVRCMCVHCMSICNTPETGHIYSLHRARLDAITAVPPGQCLLKQHHSLIFNNLLNSVSWRRFCYHVSHW